MRYFIDTEFMEVPPTSEHPGMIDLISIALVRGDGEALYEISSEFDPALANPWVKANVLAKLPSTVAVPRRTRAEIRDRILRFVSGDPVPRFWGYFADYDWVCLAWLFGPMVALPKGWPMFCLDMKQTMAELRIRRDELPPDPANAHDALEDALWLRGAFEIVRERAHRIGIELP